MEGQQHGALPFTLNMPDDSGFLGIVDPNEYSTFVTEDWTLGSLFQHFRSEMNRRTLLLWETGSENDWDVEISVAPVPSELPVARRTTGPIRVTNRELVLVNYEMLSTVAQFEDQSLTAELTRLGIGGVELPNGDYVCTISQLTSPDMTRMHDGPDFHLRLISGDAPVWVGPAWSKL